MSKELEALKEIKSILEEFMFHEDIDELLVPIEKDLEVLKILKNKEVDIHFIKTIMRHREYDYYPYDNLTRKEFNKIKEWIEKCAIEF